MVRPVPDRTSNFTVPSLDRVSPLTSSPIVSNDGQDLPERTIDGVTVTVVDDGRVDPASGNAYLPGSSPVGDIQVMLDAVGFQVADGADGVRRDFPPLQVDQHETTPIFAKGN